MLHASIPANKAGFTLREKLQRIAGFQAGKREWAEMKKRMIAVLLVCGLILSAAGHVSRAKAGPVLDAAFEAGWIVVAGNRMPLPGPKSCEIVMPPDGFWEDCIQDKPEEDQLRQDLANGMTEVFSIAPDGSCAVGYLGEIPVICRDGKVLVMHPAGYGEGEEPDGFARYCCRQLYGYEYEKLKGKKWVTAKEYNYNSDTNTSTMLYQELNTLYCPYLLFSH